MVVELPCVLLLQLYAVEKKRRRSVDDQFTVSDPAHPWPSTACGTPVASMRSRPTTRSREIVRTSTARVPVTGTKHVVFGETTRPRLPVESAAQQPRKAAQRGSTPSPACA